MKFRIFSFVLSAAVIMQSTLAAVALPVADAVKLTPHRAIYDITLDEVKSGSGVSSLRGRLVFELSGSSCDGYTINMRFVTQVTDEQGQESVTDLRSSTWEQGNGEVFRFNSSQYLNQNLSQITSGDAKKIEDKELLEIRLRRPTTEKVQFQSKTLFPSQHNLNILKAAVKGENILQASVYDGSEKGTKVFETTAVIGKQRKVETEDLLKGIKNGETLKDLSFWPVTVAYFDKKPGEMVPSYQIGFRLYENGISNRLVIDYGEFSVKGALREIELFKEAKCK